MKILHTVEFYEPSKGGAQEVMKQLSERLAARGHSVTVATSAIPGRTFKELNGVRVEAFGVRGNAVKGIRGEVNRYREFLLDSDFDIMMNYAAQTWTTDLALPLLDSLKYKKVLAPLGYSKLQDRRYATYFQEFPRYLRKYDRLVYTSSRYQDKEFGDRFGLASQSVVIPNGASAEEFRVAPQGFRERYGIRTPLLFLSVSNHYWAKGHLFILRAFKRANVKDATLVIIGETPQAHSWYSCYPICTTMAIFDSSVKVLTDVPRPWVVAAYREADLFLFGSKVECAPLVMYESFASRTPFITTRVGNVEDHADLVRIVPDQQRMVEEIRSFARNPEPFRALADRAMSVFEQQFEWNTIASQFEQLYQTLVDSPVSVHE